MSQQVRETSPYDSSPKYLIFDRAANFGGEVVGIIPSLGILPKQTSSEVLGRTESSVAAAWICSTTSLRSASGI